jgi:O-antigen/teichoic acid export membrane protein
LGAGLSVVFGLIQIRYFTMYFNESAGLLLTLLSLYVYLSFFDLGLTKPVYAELRSDYLRFGIKRTKSFPWLFLALSVLVFGFGYVLVFNVSKLFDEPASKTSMLFLSFSFACSLYFLFLRAVYEAFDMHFIIECIDVMRKVLMVLVTLIIPFLVTYDSYFIIFGYLNLLVILISIILLILYSEVTMFRFDEFKEDFARVRRDGIENFTYSITDMAINNSGIIMVPYLYDDKFVIVYHLWLKMYRGMSIVYRSLMDAEIPELTRLIYENRIADVKSKAFKFMKYTIYSLIGVNILIWVYSDEVFNLFKVSLLSDSFVFFYCLALLILMVANTIQHRIASILLSIGGYYSRLKKISVIIFGLLIVYLLLANFWFITLAGFLTILSSIMLLSGLVHLILFKRCLDELQT